MYCFGDTGRFLLVKYYLACVDKVIAFHFLIDCNCISLFYLFAIIEIHNGIVNFLTFSPIETVAIAI